MLFFNFRQFKNFSKSKVLGQIIIFFLFFSSTCLAFTSKIEIKLKRSQINFIVIDSSDYVKKFIKKGYSKQTIIATTKGQRPMPSEYLKHRYIRRHIRPFKRGASLLIPEIILTKFGRDTIGRADGQFVMSRKSMNSLLNKANGHLDILETELGIPNGTWKNSRLIRIDIPKPQRLHIRIPSGNEAGANELWIPGGKLPKGYSESVIDRIPKGKYTETLIILK